MNFTLTVESYNAKIGGIPVSTSSSDTCPPSCPLKDRGCYAKEGPMRFRWHDIDIGKVGVPWKEFCAMVAMLPDDQLWRHNQAGDLPGEDNDISANKLIELVKVNKGKRGFTYTHKTHGEYNLSLINYANTHGFTVNLSANNHNHADELFDWGPVNLILPSWIKMPVTYTPRGRKIKMCPAIHEEKTCVDCRWCQNAKRKFIVGIPAHGSGCHKVNEACGYIKNSGRMF